MEKACCDLPPCGAFSAGEDAVLWRVWAPAARRADLVLFDAGGRRETVPLAAEARGHFSALRRGIAEGQRYAFRLDGGPERPDPASRWQPEGVHRPSAVFFPERFAWTDSAWRGVARENLVIYELHVGTFTEQGTLDAVIPRLAELRDLGITAIELLPVAQFPGERGWGYDGVHPFAVQNSYGGPQALQRFVNECHRHGLAVILDVVYNHFGPEGCYLGEFGPYFSDRYRTPWGKAVNFDDRGCDAVRAFVIGNARQWVRDFHLDGLRLDAVHAICDFSARHILRDIGSAVGDEAERSGRIVHVIAESNLNDVRLLDDPACGGYGLDGQWSDDFHHSIHALLTGERNEYYADFGGTEHLVKALNQAFVYDGVYSAFRDRRHGGPPGDHAGDRFVVSIQNHDQVGNRAAGDRFGTLLAPERQRLAAGLLLLSPYVPLLFMGEEYGEARPFPFFCSFSDEALIAAVRTGRRQEFAEFHAENDVPDPQSPATFHSARLSWSWPPGTWHAGLRRLYRDLLAARRSLPALRDFRHRLAEVVAGDGGPLLRLVRGNRAAGVSPVTIWFNLHDRAVRMPGDRDSTAHKLLSSESPEYAGARDAMQQDDVLLPGEFIVLTEPSGGGR